MLFLKELLKQCHGRKERFVLHLAVKCVNLINSLIQEKGEAQDEEGLFLSL
jgi:hypothetical protein